MKRNLFVRFGHPGNSLEGKNVDLRQIKLAVKLGLGPRSEEEYEVITSNSK